MEEEHMRGVHSAVDDIRRSVFTEVARLAYEGGDLNRVDLIPYQMIRGEVAKHRADVFLERAIVRERVRLALGMNLQNAEDQMPISATISPRWYRQCPAWRRVHQSRRKRPLHQRGQSPRIW